MTYESEKLTRKLLIDQQLRACGWNIIRYSEGLIVGLLSNHAVEEFQTSNGPADYALVVKGKLLGIVEAKKLDVGAANVLEQAKRYSKGASPTIGEWDGYRIPFLYSSNGELIYYIDTRNSNNLSRQIFCFHSPDALESSYQVLVDESLKWLSTNPIDIPGLRLYQRLAMPNQDFQSLLL
jgi:type I restriction enzyme R subunit